MRELTEAMNRLAAAIDRYMDKHEQEEKAKRDAGKWVAEFETMRRDRRRSYIEGLVAMKNAGSTK